jgi:stage III sporulation protein AB
VRFIGAVLVVLACTIYGLEKAAGLYKRRRTLANFLDALRFIEAELLNNARPLPEIFFELSCHAGKEVRGFFTYLSENMSRLGEESLSKLWCDGLNSDRQLSLSAIQRQELIRPAMMLGKFMGEEQAKVIESTISRLEPELLRATEEAKAGLRLYTGLGLTAGLMLAAVII